jgi:hypothetical protein
MPLRARPATEEEWTAYDFESERFKDEEKDTFVYLVVLG